MQHTFMIDAELFPGEQCGSWRRQSVSVCGDDVKKACVTSDMDGAELRAVVLQIIKEHLRDYPTSYLQSGLHSSAEKVQKAR
jgi:hypothetical protein